jgi:hypothetical protein
MATQKANAAASCKTRGALKSDLAGQLIISENSASRENLQVSRLLSRFAWSQARARAVAELAFDQGRRR